MEDKFTREGDKRFTLRIEKELFEELTVIAKKNKRAIGRQIEFFLEQAVSFEKQKIEKAEAIKNVLSQKGLSSEEIKNLKQNISLGAPFLKNYLE